MGNYTLREGVDTEHLDPDFRDKKVDPWLKSLPFDTVIYSAFRSHERQKELNDAYNAWLRYSAGDGPKVPYANPANKPGTSAHEFGFAVDVHPSPETKENWKKLHDTCGAYGLVMDKPREVWHAQQVGWVVPSEKPVDPTPEPEVVPSIQMPPDDAAGHSN
jgi:hypothetical protein